MRRFTAILALVTLTLIGGFTYGTPTTAALSGTIALTVQCTGNPERTTVTNNTDTALDLAGSSITSLVSPRQGVEPFALSGTLAPGASRTYETGSAATSNVPTRQSIYTNTDPNEGARLSGPYGSVSVLCSAGSGSLAVTQPTATPSPTAQPTATMTTTPVPTMTATAVATAVVTVTMPVATATTIPTMTATATLPVATSTPAPTMTVAPTPTIAPTATVVPVMPGLPNTGAGGGSQSFGALGAILIAIMGASGLAARLVTRRR